MNRISLRKLFLDLIIFIIFLFLTNLFGGTVVYASDTTYNVTIQSNTYNGIVNNSRIPTNLSLDSTATTVFTYPRITAINNLLYVTGRDVSNNTMKWRVYNPDLTLNTDYQTWYTGDAITSPDELDLLSFNNTINGVYYYGASYLDQLVNYKQYDETSHAFSNEKTISKYNNAVNQTTSDASIPVAQNPGTGYLVQGQSFSVPADDYLLKICVFPQANTGSPIAANRPKLFISEWNALTNTAGSNITSSVSDFTIWNNAIANSASYCFDLQGTPLSSSKNYIFTLGTYGSYNTTNYFNISAYTANNNSYTGGGRFSRNGVATYTADPGDLKFEIITGVSSMGANIFAVNNTLWSIFGDNTTGSAYLWYTTSSDNGVTWTTPVNFWQNEGSASLSESGAFYDSYDNKIHVYAGGTKSGNTGVHHITYDLSTSTWSSSTFILSGAGDSDAQAAIDDKYTHWITNENPVEAHNKLIWKPKGSTTYSTIFDLGSASEDGDIEVLNGSLYYVYSSNIKKYNISYVDVQDTDNQTVLISNNYTGDVLLKRNSNEKIFTGLLNQIDTNGMPTITAPVSNGTNNFDLVNMSVTPSSDSVNLTVDTWNTSGTYYKKWTESSDTHDITTAHTVGDLKANTYYTINVDSAKFGTYLSNGSGQITFTYNGGYSTKTFEVQEDTTAPTGGSITYTDGYHTTESVSLTTSDGTDSGSEINTSTRAVQRKSATLSNGTCGSYGSFVTIILTGTYPNFTDSTVAFGNCYQYQYQVSDNAGNQATYTSLNVAKVTTPGPATTVTDHSTAPPTCGNTPPSSSPSLYAASSQDSSSVLLYFTDAGDPVSSYAVEYGTSPGSYQYSALSIGTKGTRTYLVASLLPATTYYFRVRGGNGCAAGSWSNEISAKTKGLVSFNQLDITQSELESKPSEETPPSTASCKTYTVKSGDTLWSIAENLLGDGEKYKEIIGQNNDKYPSLETSNNLEAGWELKVNCGKQTTSETQNIPATEAQGGYDVKVKVLDTNKKPVEGAKVTIHSKVQETVTNKDGIAQFKNVEAGDHKVLIAYENYEGEQSVNLTGNVKEFDLNVTVSQKAISLSPLAYGIVGIMGLVVIVLAVLLIKAKRKK